MYVDIITEKLAVMSTIKGNASKFAELKTFNAFFCLREIGPSCSS